MATIKADELYKVHDKMAELRMKTFNELLNICVVRIKKHAAMGHLSCYYVIPDINYYTTCRPIDKESCANYLIRCLTTMNVNLKASFDSPNLLLIDWRRDTDY